MGLLMAQPDGRRAAGDHRPAASLGAQLQLQRDLSDAEGLLATMVVILVIGIVVDLAVFGTLERRIQLAEAWSRPRKRVCPHARRAAFRRRGAAS